MRFLQFNHNGIRKLGFENPDGNVLDISGLPGFQDGLQMLDLIRSYEVLKGHVEGFLSTSPKPLPRSGIHFLPPISNPDKVICVGMNYKDHCEEQGLPLPKEPIIFNKFPSTITGPYDDIIYPEETSCLDWEVELAIVIGKAGKNIDASSAMDHVFGYTVAHDLSARDWQLERNGGQWLLGKSMDTFCPLGPVIVTLDEIKDPHILAIKCRVNGVTKQNSSTSELVHKTEDLIAFISRFTTLLPGDVILTGTPPGVGCFRKPPEYLKKGDVVECEVEQIGTIVNKVV